MLDGSSRAVGRHLRTLYQFGVVGSLSDEELLDRYLARRDEPAEDAFAELVQRHGPMVLGVCRRILGDAHAAEDAFQATFLILARKAAMVVRREKVAGWLYIVAVRTAREARARAARHRAREKHVSRPITVEPPDEEFPDEQRAIVDEELARLPARYRDPLVLCELEGLSRPEAARRLGIPEGTLSSRLARGKDRLRVRLVARGVSPATAAISAILIREVRALTVPLSWLESTVGAATLVAAGPAAAAAISAPVASLSQGVLKAMFLAKLKGIVLGVGTLTAIVSGALVLAQDTVAQPLRKTLDADALQVGTNGCPIQLWDFNGGWQQQWRLVPVGHGWSKIENRASGKVLDAEADRTSLDGCRIQLWDDHGGHNQRWNLLAVGEGWSEVENGGSGVVLDADALQVGTNGCPIQLWDFNGGWQQQWRLVPVGHGWSKIENRASGKALDADSNRLDVYGARITLWEFHGGPNHLWRLVPTGGGWSRLENGAGNRPRFRPRPSPVSSGRGR
jgi:RNA polymerase sigma factor (sigma-70 family)